MENQKKIQVLKTLSAGDVVTLTDGRTVEFVEVKRTKWVGIIDGTRYSIPASMFTNNGEELSDEILLEKARAQQSKQTELNQKKAQLKALKPGDIIEVTSGEMVAFLKLNRTRFVGEKNDGLAYDFPIAMFVKLVENRKVDPEKERIKKLAKKYKGHTIQTGWGPSKIGTLSSDEKYVKMYEFGEERYDLTLEDFLEELKSNGLA
jgi:preprotein translocase subunit YajC